MSGIAHFLAMGGYARFVWPAYGVATAVLIFLTGHSFLTYRRRQQELETLQQRRDRRR